MVSNKLRGLFGSGRRKKGAEPDATTEGSAVPSRSTETGKTDQQSDDRTGTGTGRPGQGTPGQGGDSRERTGSPPDRQKEVGGRGAKDGPTRDQEDKTARDRREAMAQRAAITGMQREAARLAVRTGEAKYSRRPDAVALAGRNAINEIGRILAKGDPLLPADRAAAEKTLAAARSTAQAAKGDLDDAFAKASLDSQRALDTLRAELQSRAASDAARESAERAASDLRRLVAEAARHPMTVDMVDLVRGRVAFLAVIPRRFAAPAVPRPLQDRWANEARDRRDEDDAALLRQQQDATRRAREDSEYTRLAQAEEMAYRAGDADGIGTAATGRIHVEAASLVELAEQLLPLANAQLAEASAATIDRHLAEIERIADQQEIAPEDRETAQGLLESIRATSRTLEQYVVAKRDWQRRIELSVERMRALSEAFFTRPGYESDSDVLRGLLELVVLSLERSLSDLSTGSTRPVDDPFRGSELETRIDVEQRLQETLVLLEQVRLLEFGPSSAPGDGMRDEDRSLSGMRQEAESLVAAVEVASIYLSDEMRRQVSARMQSRAAVLEAILDEQEKMERHVARDLGSAGTDRLVNDPTRAVEVLDQLRAVKNGLDLYSRARERDHADATRSRERMESTLALLHDHADSAMVDVETREALDGELAEVRRYVDGALGPPPLTPEVLAEVRARTAAVETRAWRLLAELAPDPMSVSAP